MNVDVFLDTNVLVYAAAGGGEDDAKRRRALRLLEEERFGLSAQVLQEFYVTVTRKAATPLSSGKAMEWIEQLSVFPCWPTDAALVQTAVEGSVRFQINYWDAAILAAAEAMGATTVYSEDLSDGQAYGGVRVVNPFGK
jgi:predicted nucleic acid-binding protein